MSVLAAVIALAKVQPALTLIVAAIAEYELGKTVVASATDSASFDKRFRDSNPVVCAVRHDRENTNGWSSVSFSRAALFVSSFIKEPKDQEVSLFYYSSLLIRLT